MICKLVGRPVGTYIIGLVRKKMRRFVIQRHSREEEPVHWDLMLEKNGILETYRVGLPPEKWGNEPVEAAKIFDHPLKFLTYEGSINKGKGQVKIADSGTYRVLTEGKKQRQLKFTGRILKGKFQLLLVKKAR
jgi:bifunctional non-homologous end joining protein LigD